MAEFTLSINKQSNHACPRQIAFVGCFLLPMAKLLEAPSILAKYAEGDLLLPALFHFLLQGGILVLLLYASSKSSCSLFERLHARFGNWTRIFYGALAVYFLFIAVIPLLDLEKYTYAVFFDTSPTVFSFGFFFLLSAFFCTKGFKALGRVADFSLFLFVVPFLALLAMSLGESDFSRLLPWFGTDFRHTMSAFTHTFPHFSDAILLLPLIGNLRYEKGDGKKIVGGYALGCITVLIFLAFFFGVFGAIAPREHYAFSKIARYFPMLTTIGRVDLLFVYLLTIVLLFYTCMPLLYAVECATSACNGKNKLIFTVIFNLGALIFLFYCNKYYNALYAFFTGQLPLLFFFIADMLPLLFLLLPKDNPKLSTL